MFIAIKVHKPCYLCLWSVSDSSEYDEMYRDGLTRQSKMADSSWEDDEFGVEKSKK
jgi:hypothetical protein